MCLFGVAARNHPPVTTRYSDCQIARCCASFASKGANRGQCAVNKAGNRSVLNFGFGSTVDTGVQETAQSTYWVAQYRSARFLGFTA